MSENQISSHFPIRIYYEDTDFSGNVYHATYLKFMERGRTELLRERGVHHTALAKRGLGFVVRHMDVWYDKPAVIDDELVVETRARGVRGARLELEQTIMRGDKTLVRAQVLVVMVSDAGKPARVPADVLKLLGL